MADTAFATGDALTKKAWSADVIKEAKKTEFFDKWTGNGSNSIIVVKNDLLKEKGDRITIPLRMRLTGDGGTDNTPEGSEEEMVFYDFSATIDYQYNNVKAKDKMSLKRPAFDLRNQFRDGLVDWWAEFKDRKTLAALSASPTTNRRVFAGSATTDATLTTSDTFSTAVISEAKRKAQLSTPKIRPVMSKGGHKYYIMLAHQYQLKALKAETAANTWAVGIKDAGMRGDGNPIFTGADFYWDGVFIFEYERVLTRLAGNSFEAGDACAVNTARAVLCGAQAGIHAFGQLPEWHEKLFQYNTIPGVMLDMIWATEKAVFNSEDFGSITVDTHYIVD